MKPSISFRISLYLIVTSILLALFLGICPITCVSSKTLDMKMSILNQVLVRNIAEASFVYAEYYKDFPDKLDTFIRDANGVHWMEETCINDAWKRPIVYQRENDNVLLVKSYGKDGQPGGTDSNADLIFGLTILRHSDGKIEINRETIPQAKTIR